MKIIILLNNITLNLNVNIKMNIGIDMNLNIRRILSKNKGVTIPPGSRGGVRFFFRFRIRTPPVIENLDSIQGGIICCCVSEFLKVRVWDVSCIYIRTLFLFEIDLF